MINYASTYAWAMDFWRAFLAKPKFIRFFVKVLMGKYAWNELVGMKDAIEKTYPEVFDIEYSCENQEYHKEFSKYKKW